ncbi:MAG: hypothetical protein GX819_06410 [Clostridiaceae bacterium]|nr:hypothetical protein [Clostridiaceae bacterium]
MRDSGDLFGWLISLGFLLTLLNYPVKLIYRKFVASKPRESKFRGIYVKFQRFIVSNHRYFAFLTGLFLLAHVIIQLLYRWLSWTGLIAALLMVANLLIGSYGHYIKKKRPSAWLVIHRAAGLLLLAAIMAHVLTGGR